MPTGRPLRVVLRTHLHPVRQSAFLGLMTDPRDIGETGGDVEAQFEGKPVAVLVRYAARARGKG